MVDEVTVLEDVDEELSKEVDVTELPPVDEVLTVLLVELVGPVEELLEVDDSADDDDDDPPSVDELPELEELDELLDVELVAVDDVAVELELVLPSLGPEELDEDVATVVGEAEEEEDEELEVGELLLFSPWLSRFALLL